MLRAENYHEWNEGKLLQGPKSGRRAEEDKNISDEEVQPQAVRFSAK